MNIQRINIYINNRAYNNGRYQNRQQHSTPVIENCGMPKPSIADSFIKTNTASPVSFTALNFVAGREFEARFPHAFFRKLIRERIPDAYTGMILIAQEEVDSLKKLEVLKNKSSVAMPYLMAFKQQLYPIEKEVLSILEGLSKKHPDKNIQQLLQLRYPVAEEKLINKQTTILNKINMKIRDLPQQEYKKLRKLIQESFDKMFEKNPKIEDRFRRQDFIRKLKRIPISDKKVKTKILEIAEQLPNSSDNLNAFIVKYSQPFKLTKTGKKVPRTSEDIAIRLLYPSLGTDDHIHPQTLFKKEKFEKRKNSHNWEYPLRVTILTSKRINEFKSDTFIDKFIESCEFDVVTNIERHIQHLIFVCEKWTKHGRLQDAADLADYITILRDEFHRRSKLIKIDLNDFEEKIPKLKDRLAISQAKQLERANKKNYR